MAKFKQKPLYNKQALDMQKGLIWKMRFKMSFVLNILLMVLTFLETIWIIHKSLN